VAGQHQAFSSGLPEWRRLLEPYVPSRFARQFGYDQLYVGNPNINMAFIGPD